MDYKHFDTIVIESGINARCCLTWSDDNKFLIIGEDGVHIYELCPLSSDVFSSSLVHSWIPGSSVWPFYDLGVNGQLNNIIWTFDRKRLCQIAIDSFIPTIGTKNVSNKPRIVQTFFSPLINGESYISCLAENGSLDLYKMSTNTWSPIINVVKEWIDDVMSAQAPSDLDLDSFKARIFQFKIVTHIWFVEKEQIFLVTGHRDGTICIWNVNDGIDGPLKLTPGIRVRVEGIPCVLTMERSADSSLFFLFVGLFSGKVKLFLLENSKENIVGETESYKKNDFVPPNQIKIHRRNNVLYVLVVKHDILVIQTCKTTSENAVEVTETKWFEFPAPIIGLCDCGDDFVVGLQDHRFRKLEFGENGFSVKDLDVSFRTKGETDVYCYGIAPSKNGALWIVASSSKISKGNKSAKDFPRLKFYSSSPVRYKSLSDSTGRELIEKMMNGSSDIKMIEISDILELKKLELLAEPSLFQSNYAAGKDKSSTRLKLLLWEVRLKILCYSADLDDVANRLEICLAEKKMEDFRSAKFSNFRNSQLQECCICQENSIRKNFKVSSCPNFHQFPLCCINFSSCNKAPYAFCKYCNSVALLELVSKRENRCLYCDGLLTADDRLLPRNLLMTSS